MPRGSESAYLPAPPSVIAACTVAALHAVLGALFGVSLVTVYLRIPQLALRILLMEAAVVLVVGLLAVLGWLVWRRKRAARAPLLVLFGCEFMAFLVTIGNYPWWVSALGLLSGVGIWGLLAKSTRDYLGVEDVPKIWET